MILSMLLGCLPFADAPDGTEFEGPWRWVGVSESQICAINTNRKVACVRPNSGAPEWKSHWDNYLTLDGGAGGICALTEQGEVDCTLTTQELLHSQRPSSNSWDKIRVGSDGACVLRDSGDLRCWGEDTGQRLSAIPEDQLFADASIEENFGAGVTLDGVVWVWGEGRPNAQGQMDNTAQLTSLDVGTERVIAASENEAISIARSINTWDQSGKVQAAGGTVCFLTGEGTIECVLGLESPETTRSFRDMDVAPRFGCGVMEGSGQRIQCWGDVRQFPFEATAPPSVWGFSSGEDSDTGWL